MATYNNNVDRNLELVFVNPNFQVFYFGFV